MSCKGLGRSAVNTNEFRRTLDEKSTQNLTWRLRIGIVCIQLLQHARGVQACIHTSAFCTWVRPIGGSFLDISPVSIICPPSLHFRNEPLNKPFKLQVACLDSGKHKLRPRLTHAPYKYLAVPSAIHVRARRSTRPACGWRESRTDSLRLSTCAGNISLWTRELRYSPNAMQHAIYGGND